MKRMEITYHEGKDAPKRGSRIALNSDSSSVDRVLDGNQKWMRKASSNQMSLFFAMEYERGRQKWAQLCVELDGVSLYFWLPQELEHMCEVFSMKPFPTAHRLVLSDGNETDLNRHWLSRLPKQVKALKFRERFLSYIQTEPKALREFRSFYGGLPELP